MSYFAHLGVAALLAASLAPAAAQARSAGHYSAVPAATLVATQGAQAAQAHGRASERAVSAAAFTVAPSQPQPQYAVASDDGYLG
ncbi:MAG TPA: hypothetical protein VEQ16_07050 [Acidocella sp.]|jgi:hypothetical protein|nr:hypothetical protein [Acidocella sp.]